MNKLKVSYTKEEYYALMRAIKAENINNITRVDLRKIFFIDLIQEEISKETYKYKDPVPIKKLIPDKNEKTQQNHNKFIFF